MTYEGFRLKILGYFRKYLANMRKKHLKHTHFTIISNNCWGGMIYESYNLPKESPTIGCFFMAEDYIKFVARLKEYLEVDLEFIKPQQSKWRLEKEVSGDKRFGKYPVGVLRLDNESIEVFFLHYKSEEEVKSKWIRRCERINWDKILLKFNDQNGCTQKHIDDFFSLPYKKVFFTCKDWPHRNNEYIFIKQPQRYKTITASHEPFGKSRYVDMTEVLNDL